MAVDGRWRPSTAIVERHAARTALALADGVRRPGGVHAGGIRVHAAAGGDRGRLRTAGGAAAGALLGRSRRCSSWSASAAPGCWCSPGPGTDVAAAGSGRRQPRCAPTRASCGSRPTRLSGPTRVGLHVPGRCARGESGGRGTPSDRLSQLRAARGPRVLVRRRGHAARRTGRDGPRAGVRSVLPSERRRLADGGGCTRGVSSVVPGRAAHEDERGPTHLPTEDREAAPA